MRLVIAVCLVMFAASMGGVGAFEIQFGGKNAAGPKPGVYHSSETQIVVYDMRPELGIGMQDMGAGARAMVSNLGVRLVRCALYWDRMEPTDKAGVYDSKYLDEWTKITAACREEGIFLCVVIDSNAPSAGQDAAKSYQRLADFAADMAKRFPSVVYWQLGDTAQTTALLGSRNNLTAGERGKQYAQLLKLAYPAIKAANPAAWVSTFGISDEEFLKGLYEAGSGGLLRCIECSTG